MRLTRLIKEFFASQRAGGVILLICTILSLVLANSNWQNSYKNIWSYSFNHHQITQWINDGLMAIFFLLIGIELKREVYIGELSEVKSAMLPFFAALGGMIVPAGIHLFFNYGSVSQSGAGIPMATDIAFAIGILSLLGNRVPPALKVFLTALAVIDDLGAIIVISVFYTSNLSWFFLLSSIGVFVILLLLNKLKVKNLLPYLIGGIAMWYFMLHSGVHATITGVLVAFTIPLDKGHEKSPSYILQHYLHWPVAFIILPLFALANTCLTISQDWEQSLFQINSIGILFGLIIGKPLGIFIFSFLVVIAGMCVLPEEMKWKHLFGAGLLGGIGFTMSIFISMLAFSESTMINESKMAILFSSLTASIMGLMYLFIILKADHKNYEE